MSRHHRGFTFIECLAGILILTLGFFAIIALIMFAQRLANRSQADATAMGTAMSAAVDPAPLAGDGDWDAAAWTRAGYDLESNGAISCEMKGFLNGLYVVRRETSAAADIIAPGVRSVWIQVDVSVVANGEKAASYSTRLIRQSTPALGP